MAVRDLYDGILGMNRRTLCVSRENSPRSIRLVNSKYSTKIVLQRAGVPTVPTIAVIAHIRDLMEFDWNQLPDKWALKPDRGAQGAGILLSHGYESGCWRTGSQQPLCKPTVADRVRSIIDGEYSMEDVARDMALFEQLVLPHDLLAGLVSWGLPDVRIICYRSEPIMAMMRLPTLASGGRANLHQGAVGAAIDIASGVIGGAMLDRQGIVRHPDTGRVLRGVQLPSWDTILAAARTSSSATGLGYSGVDVVIDRERGPLVIEVNARPGLEIQNINGYGLLPHIRRAEALSVRLAS